MASNNALLDDITGALDWWREAGVDCDFADEPIQWLAPPVPEGEAAMPVRRARPAPEHVAQPVPVAIDPATLPADLSAFANWWMSEPLLCEGGPAARVAPQGKAGAKAMIVVEEPEAEDTDALLCGPDGKLLDAILQAFGMTRDEVYLASALPRHTPGADWEGMAQRGIAQVLHHHVRLVSPERLIVMGKNVLPLINHESPQPPAILSTFAHEGGSIPLLASWALSALRTQPRAKPALWKAWLEWTAS